MMSLQDYHNSSIDTGGTSAFSNNWKAQTFTAGANYLLTAVKLLLRRSWDGTSTFTVSIRNTSSGIPTSIDLISKTLANVSLLQNTSSWIECLFDTPLSIVKDQIYAIVLAAPIEISSTAVQWRSTSDNLYSGGGRCSSADSGVTWGSPSTSIDYLFETYGLRGFHMKLGDTFNVTYQATGRATGQTIGFEVFDEAAVKVDAQSGDMVEDVVVAGVYQKSFLPDALGSWRVDITDGPKKIIKEYIVTTEDTDSLGLDVAVVDSKVDTVGTAIGTVDGKIDTANTAIGTVDGKVDTVSSAVGTVDTKVTTVSGKVDTVEGKVDTVSSKADAISAKCDDVITALSNLDIQADSSPGMIG